MSGWDGVDDMILDFLPRLVFLRNSLTLASICSWVVLAVSSAK